MRYTQVTVGPGSGSTTISLSAAYPTLVIRGPQPFAATCNSAGDCWDSNLCQAVTATSTGACGWSGTELPPTCTGTNTLDTTLDDCVDLWARELRDTASNYDPTFSRTDSCVGAGNQIASLAASCPIQKYRDAYDKVVFDVIAASQRQLQTSSTGGLMVADVQSHLKRIGNWYDAYRQNYPASSGDTTNQRVWAETSRVLGSFWQAAYARVGMPQPSPSPNPSDAILDSLFQNGLEADRTVLLAALTSPVPITTAPLVELMGDALQSISTRLGQVAFYHDLACRFRDNPAAGQYSCDNGQLKTEISELTHFIAAQPDPTELAQLVVAPTPAGTSPNWERWKAVFTALYGQHAAFRSAVLDALPGVSVYLPGLIVPPLPSPGAPLPPPTQATPPLMAFSKIVQDARIRSNSYQLTGLFDSRHQGILRAGIQQDRVNGVISTVQGRTSTLNSQLANYTTTRQQLATGILKQMTNLASQQSIIDQISQRLTQEAQLRQDLAGLRNTIEIEEARYGEFMQAYTALSDLVANNAGTAVSHFASSATVRAGDARWPVPAVDPAASDPLSSFVSQSPLIVQGTAQGWPLVARKGDILNLNTSGTWSPSCALHTATFVNPLDPTTTTGFTVPTPALTGPEGYLVSIANNTFNVTTNQSVHSVDHYVVDSDGSKQCAGGGLSLGFDLGNLIGLGKLFDLSADAHASGEWCHTHEEGWRTSDLTSNGVSNGVESRMSASFATGLRVHNTPFPTFPAGSLLLVQVARGGTARSDIQDVQVLQKPYSSIVMGADADVYLVINDIVDPACGSADPSALTASIDQMRPFGAIAAQLGQGMSNALANLRSEEALLLEQGRVGPQQMASLRDQAFVDLVQACGLSCSSASYYPPEILKFFDAWVGKQLATLERKVDARTIEREIVLIDLQHAELANDLQNLGAQAPLLTLMSTWLLKDLDWYLLDSNTHSLVDMLVADLYPIIDLKRPDTLQYLDPNLLNKLLGFPVVGVQLDWTGSLVDWTTAAVNASTNITDRLHDQLLLSPTANDHIVAVGIPNPYASIPTNGGNWQRVPPERAKPVWDAIVAQAPFVSVPIGPTDLYDMIAGATDVMLCNEAVPVITAVAIYMVKPGVGFTEPYAGLLVPTAINRDLVFPGVSAVKNYRIDNDDWLNVGVRLTAGEATDMETTIGAIMADNATTLYRVGNGLSPFTQFDISLPPITTPPTYGRAPTDGASELVIAFRVQTRNVADVHLNPMCP